MGRNYFSWKKVLIKIKLDSGSDLNIISLKTYNKIVKSVDKNIKIYNKIISVETYGDTNINVMGIIKLRINLVNNKNLMSYEDFL